jgi:hypothetical protein
MKKCPNVPSFIIVDNVNELLRMEILNETVTLGGFNSLAKLYKFRKGF